MINISYQLKLKGWFKSHPDMCRCHTGTTRHSCLKSDIRTNVFHVFHVTQKLYFTNVRPSVSFTQFIHRYYLTLPRSRQMKLGANPSCHFYHDNTIGIFFYLVWQWQEVNRFWENVSSIMSNIIWRAIHHWGCPLLFNDPSSLELSANDRHLLVAGHQKPPHTPSVREGLCLGSWSFYQLSLITIYYAGHLNPVRTYQL